MTATRSARPPTGKSFIFRDAHPVLGAPYPTDYADAACKVFCSKVATVMGPTPPGTGVIQLVCFFALSKSISPTILLSVKRVIPASMTTASDAIHFD